MKRQVGIIEKLKRKGFDILEEIYILAEKICQQDDISWLRRKITYKVQKQMVIEVSILF